MIGIDITEVSRIRYSDRFLQKIAYQDEIDYIMKESQPEVQIQKIAALWSVKEAVMKALGLGQDSGVVFKDIKLCHEKSGKPFVELFGVAKEAFAKYPRKKLEVSLSHTKTCAVAVALIV